MNDNRTALAMLDVLAPASDQMWFTVIDGAPRNNSLPRFRTILGNKILSSDPRQATRAALRQLFSAPVAGNLAVGCVFFRPNRQRMDVDNMLKHVCDSATGIVWHDDSQVTSVMGRVELDCEHPRTIVLIAKHESTMVRNLGAVVECPICGTGFIPPTSKRRMLCSEHCRIEFQRKRNRDSAKRIWKDCITCGAKTSRPGVLRCRSCWLHRSESELRVGAATV